MKKSALFLLALMLALPVLNAQEAPDGQREGRRHHRDTTLQEGKSYSLFGVMFYNLENLFDTINNNGNYDLEFSPQGARQWNSQKYWSKQHNMADAINRIFPEDRRAIPALIGVSEIENITVLQDLVKQPEIRRHHFQIVHHDGPDRRGVDVGLLYNPRVFRVLNVTNQRLVVPGYEEFRTRDQMCVTGLLAGEKVSVIINHWPSRLGGQERSSYLREAAGDMARRTIDSLLRDDPNQGIFFMGDLNDDPMDISCAVNVGGKKKMEDVVEVNDMYNPFWEKLDKGIGTLGYRGSWNLFDQIMCSEYFLRNVKSKEKPTLTFLRADVLNREFLKSNDGDRTGYPLRTYSGGVFLNGYSDHFPTRILIVKERDPNQQLRHHRPHHNEQTERNDD